MLTYEASEIYRPHAIDVLLRRKLVYDRAEVHSRGQRVLDKHRMGRGVFLEFPDLLPQLFGVRTGGKFDIPESDSDLLGRAGRCLR